MGGGGWGGEESPGKQREGGGGTYRVHRASCVGVRGLLFWIGDLFCRWVLMLQKGLFGRGLGINFV
jgi:hypothetical protein